MVRFLLLSLGLHAALVLLFILRKEVVIEDPIEAVQIQLDQNLVQKPTGQATPTTTSTKPVTAPNSRIEKRPSDPSLSESSNLSQDFSGAYETGTVTKKPRVLKQVQIVYPESAKQARIEGPVRLSVTIDESGSVREVRVLEGPGFGLNEAAEQALRQFQFSPAELEGKKVPVRITYVYRFKLESR